jgi:hypothetical protein
MWRHVFNFSEEHATFKVVAGQPDFESKDCHPQMEDVV